MDARTMALGCPNRVSYRGGYACKALIGQPNGAGCCPENCAAMYFADLMINDLRVEMHEMFEKLMDQGGKDEDHESTAAAARRDKS